MDNRVVNFKVQDGDGKFLGVVGNDGLNFGYKSQSAELSNAIEHYLGLMKQGLYVLVDDTDYFLVNSLKRNLETLKFKGSFFASDIIFSEGCLDDVLEDIYANFR